MKTFALCRVTALALVVAATAGLDGCGTSAPTGATPELKPAETMDLGGGVKMEFVLIQPGSFLMGTDEDSGDGDEAPVHKVTITKPFYLGRCEVTQEQWKKIMGGNPSHFKGAKLPVETVSWNDCRCFLAKLGEKTGRKFALPTEAQWEFACRAGTTNRWSFGGSDAGMGDYAWSGANSGGTTHPVGEKKPNAWGLYDMHGNVGEWCADWYAKHAYPKGDVTDPVRAGPVPDSGPVWRGGAWGDNSDYLRCAYRNCNGPDGSHYGIGLRCVMLPDEASARLAP
jgi:formylglycine-generating enzyme required for sulfatase activity